MTLIVRIEDAAGEGPGAHQRTGLERVWANPHQHPVIPEHLYKSRFGTRRHRCALAAASIDGSFDIWTARNNLLHWFAPKPYQDAHMQAWFANLHRRLVEVGMQLVLIDADKAVDGGQGQVFYLPANATVLARVDLERGSDWINQTLEALAVQSRAAVAA